MSKATAGWLRLGTLFAFLGVAVALMWLVVRHPTGILFFVLPLLTGVVGVYFVYRLSAWLVSPNRPPLSERYADGQPLGRARKDDTESRAFADKLRKDEDQAAARRLQNDADARREAAKNNPDDFRGPPPITRFP